MKTFQRKKNTILLLLFFLKKEAVDVNFIGCIEKPPLIYAVQMKSLSIAKLLIEYGSKSYLWNLK